MNLEYLSLLGDFQANIRLDLFTTFRVGGECLGVFYPDSIDNLIKGLQFLKKNNIPYKVIGNGSNILCSDKYYPGIVIKLDRYFEKYHRDGQKIMVGAGCSLMNLAHQCALMGLSGLQFAGGIPGSLGGVVLMNAGAYKHEMCEIVNRVLIIDEKLNLVWLNYDDCCFGYRASMFQKRNWIIIEIELVLDPSLSVAHIQEIMRVRKEVRVKTQPLDLPSAGSCFKNPDDIPAWKYIEDVGLRGFRVGGASVSQKHCNFIVNDKNGSAEDVLAVIQKVEQEVKKQKDIVLIREIELFNWDDDQQKA